MSATARSWTDVATAVAAVLALTVSLGSFYVSWRAYRFTVRQDERRRPRLQLHLLDAQSWWEDSGKRRVLAFKLTVTNPTDADNTAVSVELWVTYALDNGVVMTAKLPLANLQTEARQPSIAVPTRVSAHGGISGWFNFVAAKEVFASAAVQSYRLVIQDSQGLTRELTPILLREDSRIAHA